MDRTHLLNGFKSDTHCPVKTVFINSPQQCEQCDSWIALPVTQIGFGMLVQRRHSSSFTNNGWGEDDVRACVFGVFRALNILNGY